MPAKYRFETNGDFIDFYDDAMLVRTFPTDYTGFDWYYNSTPGIIFFFDGGNYHADDVADISFDGTPLDSKDGFKTALGTLFPHYATSGGGGVDGITSDGSIATYNIDDQEFNADNMRYNAGTHLFTGTVTIEHQLSFVSGATSTIIMKSPNGNSWLLTVSDAGEISITGD